MKAYSFTIENDVIVVIENEHKEVVATGKEVEWTFTSFEQALQWAKQRGYNGGIFTFT